MAMVLFQVPILCLKKSPGTGKPGTWNPSLYMFCCLFISILKTDPNKSGQIDNARYSTSQPSIAAFQTAIISRAFSI